MQSQAAQLALAVQAQKGTGATTGYTAAITTLSRLVPEFRYVGYENEHGIGNERSTTHKSQRDKAGLIYRLRAEGGAYPEILGVYLMGLGFTAETSGTKPYTHEFTKASNASAKYLTALHSIGEGSGRMHTRVRDVRLTNLQIQADNERVQLQVDGVGIAEEASTGNETISVPPAVRFLPSTGTFAWGTLAGLSVPRQHTVTIARPVDENDQKLHSFGLADVQEMGFAVTGQMTGVDMSKDVYNLLVRGGGQGASTITVTDSLTFSYESGGPMEDETDPYLFQVALRKVDVTLTSFEASGNNAIRCDLTWQMIDDDPEADPITITLEDLKQSYA